MASAGRDRKNTSQFVTTMEVISEFVFSVEDYPEIEG